MKAGELEKTDVRRNPVGDFAQGMGCLFWIQWGITGKSMSESHKKSTILWS